MDISRIINAVDNYATIDLKHAENVMHDLVQACEHGADVKNARDFINRYAVNVFRVRGRLGTEIYKRVVRIDWNGEEYETLMQHYDILDSAINNYTKLFNDTEKELQGIF